MTFEEMAEILGPGNFSAMPKISIGFPVNLTALPNSV